jgi:serine/threonine protein kinase
MRDLQHEAAIYRHLELHQGSIIPVCLGGIDLVHPYYYDFGVQIVHMMLLGWGGDCLEGINENKAPWSNRIKRSVEVIHGAGILHGDLRTANMLWNNRARSVMLIDFERAVLWTILRHPPILFAQSLQIRENC